jgi:hypothetical protein
VTTDTIWVLLALGGVGGVVVGRWWAENARARFDQQRVWSARKNYRKSGRSGSAPPPTV